MCDYFLDKYRKIDYDDILEFLNDKYCEIEISKNVDEIGKQILRENIDSVQKLIRNMRILEI